MIMPGDNHEDLSCEVACIYNGTVDDTLPYEALSYT